MKKETTYNEIYLLLTLINDLTGIKLPAKATAEKLLIRAALLKPMREFEEFKRTVYEDKDADEEAKKKAVEEKAGEAAGGFAPRRFTVEAFTQIVEAVAAMGEIASGIAAPVQAKEGAEEEPGRIPAEAWLQTLADTLVEQ